MNSKLTFAAIGVVLGALFAYLFLPPRVPDEGLPNKAARTYHDEPVIVENGSVVLDFNPRDHKKLVAFLDPTNHKWFSRAHSDPVRLIRVWLKPNGSTEWQPKLCANRAGVYVDCLGDDILPRQLRIGMSTASAHIHWRESSESGILLSSNMHAFDYANLSGKDNPYRIMSRPSTGSNQPTLDEIEFRFDTIDQRFVVGSGDKIKVQLCTSLDQDHCYYYTPGP